MNCGNVKNTLGYIPVLNFVSHLKSRSLLNSSKCSLIVSLKIHSISGQNVLHMSFLSDVLEIAFPNRNSDQSTPPLSSEKINSKSKSYSQRLRSGSISNEDRTPSDPRNAKCGCGSGDSYHSCCQSFHLLKRAESSALEVLRARFCAYKFHVIRYLMASLAPGSPEVLQKSPTRIAREISDFCNEYQPVEFEVLQTQVVGPHTTFILFRAFFLYQGKPFSCTERAKFIEYRGHWYYHSGRIVDVDATRALASINI